MKRPSSTSLGFDSAILRAPLAMDIGRKNEESAIGALKLISRIIK